MAEREVEIVGPLSVSVRVPAPAPRGAPPRLAEGTMVVVQRQKYVLPDASEMTLVQPFLGEDYWETRFERACS